MPELPDIESYLHGLRTHALGRPLQRLRMAPSALSLLKTYDPPFDALHGKEIMGFRRMGKRIVWEFEGELFAVLHLMIAGRLRLHDKGKAIPGKVGLAAFDLPESTIILTEASSKKRASLFVHRGESALDQHDRGGIEPLEADLEAFTEALVAENRTLKRALTDQRIFLGIGNAFSDEILHAAQLSPIKHSQKLDEAEIARLHAATHEVLAHWRDHLIEEVGDGFPDKVTAFRPEFAAHGKFGEPCPVCDKPIQRIRYADNETNYCAQCQTSGKVLADRSLSRILKDDWPRSIDELD